LHELLADGPDVLRECGREHHDLLLVWGRSEDLLNVATHVKLLQHLVALVENEMLHVLQAQLLALDESEQTTWSSDDDVRAVGFQNLLVLGDGQTSEENADL